MNIGFYLTRNPLIRNSYLRASIMAGTVIGTMIDLHIHSEYSVDANGTPEAIITRVWEKGIRAVSLTEHSNTRSLREGQTKAAELGLEYVAGVEYNIYIRGRWEKIPIHILGYFFHDNHPHILNLTSRMDERERLAMEAFITGLREMGIPMTADLAESRYPGGFPPGPSEGYCGKTAWRRISRKRAGWNKKRWRRRWTGRRSTGYYPKRYLSGTS